MRSTAIFYFLLAPAFARIIDFDLDAGAQPEDDSIDVAWKNGRVLNETLAKLAPGDVLVIPNKTFTLMGGILASGLHSVTIQLDGTLKFSNNIEEWPRGANRSVKDCITFNDMVNLTFSSSGKGTLNGQGGSWWGIPYIGYLIREENRPKLLDVNNCSGCLFERFLLYESPYWNLDVDGDGVEIRFVDVVSRRTKKDKHGIINLSAFNTDGIDVTGNNFWIHDCNIFNQDDCVAVKANSSNMLIERINASGLGLTIGSIGSGETVNNITFRDCYMHHTFKGIYTKFRDIGPENPAVISNVLYENIVIDEPEQVPIWIGPAQQSDSRTFWVGHPCSLFWPDLPFSSCNVPAAGSYINITLRNVVVNNPKQSPGLVFANQSNPMQNVIFDNVRVNKPGSHPWGSKYYKCEGVNGVAKGNTWPVPPCFKDETNAAAAVIV